MTGDGLATTYQWTMATLCGFLDKHEAGPDGYGSSRRIRVLPTPLWEESNMEEVFPSHSE
jgi:hypothetical protein